MLPTIDAIPATPTTAWRATLYGLLFRLLRRILENDELPTLLTTIDHGQKPR